jgi:putative ABC transport system permease protein
VYAGEYPQKQGEIVIHGSLAAKLDKDIGDTVSVNYGDSEKTFTVVGFNTGINGVNASLLKTDYKKLDPSFRQSVLMIYLEDGVDTAAFVKTMKAAYEKEEVLEVIDGDEQLAQGMSSYQAIISTMGIAILVTTFCVIALVLYFVISASIIRRRRELGIYKAIGFSTVQLMNQFSIAFMIPVIVGAAGGSFLGARFTNPLMSAMMKQSGALMPDFLVDSLWITVFCIGLIVVSYLLALLITWRIRKISAYALVTE